MGVALPPEILSIICELCTSPPGLCDTCTKQPTISFCCVKKACMSLRLVSREWNAASTPFVFEHIKLRLFPSSMEKFNKLCGSELAKHVRTLDFHPDLLPVWDKEAWLSNVLLRSAPNTTTLPRWMLDEGLEEYDEITRQSLSPEELDAGWAAYEKHMLGQERWRKNMPDLKIMLKHALLRLPNLSRSIVACCPSPYERSRYLSHGFYQGSFLRILAREIIVSPKLWLVQLTSELSNIKHVRLEDACSLAYVEAIGHRRQRSGVRRVEALTFDLKSLRPLSKLSAASEHADRVNCGHIPRRQNLLQTFTPTADLTLRFREALPFVTDRNDQTEDLRQILEAAKNLRALHLDCGNYINDSIYLMRSRFIGTHLALEPILSNSSITYHHLKELFLSAVVPGQALAGFLKLHSPSLKRLELCHSISDDWEAVLYAIARHLNLDQLRLHWLFDGYHSHFDGQSWRLKRFEDDTWHFCFHERFYWDGTSEDCGSVQHPDIVNLGGVMRKFFDGKGSLELPPGFYTEWKDFGQWGRSIRERQPQNTALQDEN